jgi:hypothetical protein
MCNPLIAAVAIAAVQQAGEYASARQAATKQRQNFNAQKKLSDQVFSLETASLRRRQGEERRAAGFEIQEILQDSLGRKGIFAASAAEGGVSGASLNALLSDFTSIELNRIFGVEENLRARDQAIEEQLRVGHLSYEQGLLRAHSQLTPEPSLLVPILGIGKSVIFAQNSAPEGSFLGLGGGEQVDTSAGSAP